MNNKRSTRAKTNQAFMNASLFDIYIVQEKSIFGNALQVILIDANDIARKHRCLVGAIGYTGAW